MIARESIWDGEANATDLEKERGREKEKRGAGWQEIPAI